jgi:gliding motility-associated lipoprotein GldH
MSLLSKNSILFFISIVIGMLVTSCTDENIIYEESHVMEGQKWNASDSVSFEFDIQDTVQKYDFFMNMRITTSYEWANCYVFMTLAGPELMAFDTVQIPLADLTGKWNGKISGSMVENNVLFMKSVRFPQAGKHKITFVQGMRDATLSEISDVGLTIVKSKN